MTDEYYETCGDCGSAVRLVFREEEDYTRAKLACDCDSAQVAFGNISILDPPEKWGENDE